MSDGSTRIIHDSTIRPAVVRAVRTIPVDMGSKQSSASDSETLPESPANVMPGSVGGLNRHHRRHHYHRHHASGARSRARSFGGVPQREGGASSSAAIDIDVGGVLDLERPRSRSVIAAGSVPVRVFSFGMIFHLLPLYASLQFRNGTTPRKA